MVIKMKTLNKKIQAKENMVEKWTIKEFEQITKKTVRSALKNILINDNGTASVTDSYRLLQFKQFYDAGEPMTVDAKTGKQTEDVNYPNVDRLVRDHSDQYIGIPVLNFYNMIATLKVDAKKYGQEAIKIDFTGDQITFTPIKKDYRELVQSSITVQGADYPGITFAANVEYLTQAFLYFKRLKIENITLGFDSSIRPLQFEADDMTYLITLVRTF